MTDPLRPHKEAIIDQIVATGLDRKNKEIAYLQATGDAQERALIELLAVQAKEDELVEKFNSVADPSEQLNH